jgi:hypothetical protein
MLSLCLTITNIYRVILDFFKYTIWRKKSPYKEMRERDPYIYEE